MYQKRNAYRGFSLFLSFFSNFTIKIQTGCFVSHTSIEALNRGGAKRGGAVAQALAPLGISKSLKLLQDVDVAHHLRGRLWRRVRKLR